MKRIISAILLCAFVTLLCIIGNNHVNRFCDRFESRLNECVNLYKAEESSEKRCEELKRYWRENFSKLSFFLNHAYIDGISERVTTLPLYAGLKSDENFYAAAEEIKQILYQIRTDNRLTADSFY